MQAKPLQYNLATRWIGLCLALSCACAFAQPGADIETLEAAAQRGDAQAMVMLASRYERGENVQRDYLKSNELYCKAAVRGDAEALMKLSIIYSIGRGVMADEGVAALLVRKAAEQGNESAKRLLQFVREPTGSVLPACLNEPVAPSASRGMIAARKDIELLVQHWAPQYSIDPELVMALIAVESSFNVTAVSPKNAQGLMQLIPGTAARFGVKNVYNPLQNLKGGLAYLRWLMAYFKGEVALVLAAYNSGEETVERYRGIPPYAETRNYVKQITSVYKKASHPYLSEVVAPSPALGRIKKAGLRSEE
jgi:soluble lytic murein transglycosylase-like protein